MIEIAEHHASPERIAQLESELGLDTDSLEREISQAHNERLAARKNPDWTPKQGILLDKLHARTKDRLNLGYPNGNFHVTACSAQVIPLNCTQIIESPYGSQTV